MDYTVEKFEEWIAEEVKELQNMGMEIDIEAFRRFYYHFDRDQITGLHLPSNLRNQTLQSVLTIGYGSQSDSSGDGSSNDTDYDKSKFEEWSQVFTKDGHFRLDQILPLIPQPPQLWSRAELGMFLQNLNCARLALAHYNDENKDAPYDLVMPLMSTTFHTYAHRYYNHVNFFARSKSHDTNSSPELFFAELCTSCDDYVNPVLRCCILKPNLRGHSSEDAVQHFPPTWIFHPQDLTCRCNFETNCYFESDDDF